MDKQVSISLERLERISENAAALLNSDKVEVERLKNTISELYLEISFLKMKLKATPELLDDNVSNEIYKGVKEAIQNYTEQELLKYDRLFFISYTQPVRVVIAICLINFCTEKEYKVQPLWLDIVASNGDL